MVVGTSGSGKTSLAKELSQRLGIEAFDLDDFYWLPHWTPRKVEDYEQRLDELLEKPQWIISGNYSRYIPQMWSQADLIIWLDLPLYLLLWRAILRSVRRIVSQELCCGGNVESWSRFFSRHGIAVWIVSSYWRRKKSNEAAFKDPRYAQATRLRIQKPAELTAFLKQL